jgi:hypothetical protein
LRCDLFRSASQRCPRVENPRLRFVFAAVTQQAKPTALERRDCIPPAS